MSLILGTRLGPKREAAFAVLDRAAAESQALVAFVGPPPFGSVRDDPRFAATLDSPLGGAQER